MMNLRERKTEFLQFEDALKIVQRLIVEYILLIHSRWDKQSVVDVVIEIVPRNTVALRHLSDLHAFAVSRLPSLSAIFPQFSKKFEYTQHFLLIWQKQQIDIEHT